MLLCASITFFIVIKIKNKSQFEKLLIITIIFSITDILSNYYFIDYLKSEEKFKTFANINQYLFYFFEIATIIVYYKNLIGKKNNTKNSMIIVGLSMTITFLFFILSKIDTAYITFTLIILFELLFINFSFASLLIKQFDENISQKTERILFINYGLFIYVNFTTPFYFLNIYLSKQNTQVPDVSFINHLGYIILFSSIIMGLKWKI